MEGYVLSVLVLFLVSTHLGKFEVGASGAQRTLGSLLMEARPRSGASAMDICTIEAPEDTCVAGIPTCTAKTCTFVPEYGEEITSIWQIFLDGFSSIFSNNKKKKYRKILDLGEKLTKSFEGELCENENTICDCTATVASECSCDHKDNIKICKQKYKNKFSLYYVYNFFFCEPALDPWAAFFKKLTGGGKYHLSFAGPQQPQQNHYPYNQYSKTPSFGSIFQYMQLLKKDKHHHLGELVLCEGTERFSQNNHGYGTPEYKKHLQRQNPSTIVRHAFLKVKVPSGCDCEEF